MLTQSYSSRVEYTYTHDVLQLGRVWMQFLIAPMRNSTQQECSNTTCTCRDHKTLHVLTALWHSTFYGCSVYSRDIIDTFLDLGIAYNYAEGFFRHCLSKSVQTLNDDNIIWLYLFIPVCITLAHFQGHGRVQSQNRNLQFSVWKCQLTENLLFYVFSVLFCQTFEKQT